MIKLNITTNNKLKLQSKTNHSKAKEVSLLMLAGDHFTQLIVSQIAREVKFQIVREV